MDNNAQMTLAEIKHIHNTEHAGYRWDCRRKVKGQECRHIYQDALIRESDQQIEAQRQSAAERMI